MQRAKKGKGKKERCCFFFFSFFFFFFAFFFAFSSFSWFKRQLAILGEKKVAASSLGLSEEIERFCFAILHHCFDELITSAVILLVCLFFDFFLINKRKKTGGSKRGGLCPP